MPKTINPHSAAPQRIARIVLQSNNGISRRDIAAQAGAGFEWVGDVLEALRQAGIVGCTNSGRRSVWCRPEDEARLTSEIAAEAARTLAAKHHRHQMKKRARVKAEKAAKRAALEAEKTAEVVRGVIASAAGAPRSVFELGLCLR